MKRQLAWVAVIANGVGAIDIFVFLTFLLPPVVSSDDANSLAVVSGIVGAVYLAITLPLGIRWGRRRGAPIDDWLISERPAGPRERALALRAPVDFVLISATLWAGAALLFGLLNATQSIGLGMVVAVTIALAGLTTVAIGYLLTERIRRPVIERALAGGVPNDPLVPGVATRLTMAWLSATGVPILGIGMLAAADLLGADPSQTTQSGAVLFLAGLALIVGLFALIAAARSVADPIAGLRAAAGCVERGDLAARSPVDDGSEVGLLQAGFNRMAAGLEERERTRDLFGRHVGEEVARAALDGDVALGGEERELAALFVDVVGSTSLAHERPATEVVAMLNSFFAIVVEVTEDHHGFVNKFEGDAALCVFGAPVATETASSDALRAARRLRERLATELPAVDVGVGVSAGTAVAGNIGAERRFEYTVIGDPVNEAARLCELSKERPERLLASSGTVGRADADEASRWNVGEAVTLRGRASETELATVRVAEEWQQAPSPEAPLAPRTS